LRSRFPDGLAARLKRMLDGTDAVETLSPFLPHCPGLEWRDVPRRRVYGLLFMLEDLVLYLEENMNSRFYCLGTALVVLQTQIADILTYM